MATVTLPFKKETKNMYQFQVSDDDKHEAAIPTVYIRKDQFEEAPENVEIKFKPA